MMPLPPSIIPESEESSLHPLSEASSGYISTSLSTATLSDVYTLSWDLPPPSPGVDDLEAATDPGHYGGEAQAESGHSALVLKEGACGTVTESTSLQSGHTRPDSSPNAPLAVQLKDQDEELDGPRQEEHEERSLTRHSEEQIHDKDSPQEFLPKTNQTDVLQKEPSDCEASQSGRRLQTATADAEAAPPVCDQTVAPAPEVEPEGPPPETQLPVQDNPTVDEAQRPDTHQSRQDAPKALEPAVDSTTDQGPQVQGTSDSSNPNGTKTSALPSTREEISSNGSAKAGPDPEPSQSKVLPSKPNPFKIQKVKSSDLHSFQGIIKTGEDGSEPSDPDSSLAAGNQLAVPMESLEIISDSEEGDAAGTVLPDWLKEGEFVTVGTNKCGTVRYVGPTDFAEGTWVGVELEAPAGRSTGSQHGPLLHCSRPH